MKSNCVIGAVPGRSFLAAALLYVLSCSLVVGQVMSGGKGSVRGQVTNEVTGKTLESVSVSVLGGTQSVLTGRDGSFTIDGLAAGSVTLVATYPGLDEQRVTVAVPESGSVTQDIKFNSATLVLDPFVVNSPYEGNAAAIAKQEKSLIVKNVIATDAWGNVSNGDMGTFLQRLPGITGNYGGSAVDSIMVRGMASVFTSISLDGARLAMSNSSSTRSQVVSSLPADAIESVEVTKTPTADMDADSLGGTVNLKTRSGFDRTGRAVSLSLSANYNETFGKHADPAGGKSVLPRYSMDYSNVFSVFGGKNNLGVSFSVAHEEVAQVLASFRLRFQSNWTYAPGTSQLRYPIEEITNEYFTNKRNDWNTRFDYKFSENHQIAFGYGYNYAVNHLDAVRPDWSESFSIAPGASPYNATVNNEVIAYQRDIRDTGNTMHRFFLSGNHKLPAGIVADWKADHSSSRVSQDRISAKPYTTKTFGYVMDRTTGVEFPKVTFTTAFTPDQEDFSTVRRMNLDGAENYRNYQYINTVDFNLKKAFNDARIPFNVKGGFRVREDHRSYDRDDFNFTSFSGVQDFSKYADHSFNYPYMAGRYLAPTMVNVEAYYRDIGYQYVSEGGIDGRKELKYKLANGSTSTNYQSAADIESTVQNSLTNDYSTTETIPAVYLQSEVSLLPKLKMTAGVRYEETSNEVTTRVTDKTKTTTEEIYGRWNTLKGKYTNTYPNLQFRFEPSKRLIFRAAFSQTIGRPDLGNYATAISPDAVNRTVTFGNASVGPQQAKNIDLSVEYYFEPSGVISVGVFEKRISDFIANLSFNITGNEYGLDLSPYVGWTGNTQANIGKGRVKGLELNYSQQFSFLPKPFNGLGISANGTWLESSGDYGSTAIANATPPFEKTLPAMRPFTGNVGLFYVGGRFDVRLMLNHQSDYLDGLNTGDYSRTNFFGARTQLDMNTRIKLSSKASLFVDIVNLNEENRGRYWGQVSRERRYYTDIFPRQVNVGMKYNF